MATIIWKGFEKEPRETLSESYELVTGKKFTPVKIIKIKNRVL